MPYDITSAFVKDDLLKINSFKNANLLNCVNFIKNKSPFSDKKGVSVYLFKLR